ncbi:CHAT domain-containing tetratricopeptide repeat protein [Calothrix sp. PCC 6303]|uniref:CHAT domain-containing tetratricopeptide repeat protein n=1 Tax=Calothrix sp. PCC 6303 TaxID=1170562 RepID=UPI0002A049BD|nr:CHAT domain-containing protein [Calothrix sp. PCC 6303]AFZ02680.1 Tetratricopeptide TPR_2 repeat-containing protein [Calothrix sp. PCC 6303]
MNRCRNNQGFIKFSLRQINYYSLICLLSMVFLSDSVGARTKLAELQIAQQPATKKENPVNRNVDPKLKALLEEAHKLQKEGQNLQQQGTLESRKQAIAKYKQALKIHQRQDVKVAFDQVRETEAVLLLAIGGIYSKLGENKKAVEYLENSLVVFRELKDNELLNMALERIAQVYTELGEKQKAFNSLNEALKLARTENNPNHIMDTLFYIAGIHFQHGEVQEALKYYNEALEIAKNINNLPKQADILSLIAQTYSILQESDKVIHFYKQALEINEKINKLLGKSGNLVGIASVYARKGEVQQVDKYVQQVLKLEGEIEQKIQQHPEIIVPDCNLDQVPEQERQIKKAECTVITKKKLIFQKYLNRREISTSYLTLFDYKQVLVYSNQQLTLAHQLGEPLEEANSLDALGGVYANLGDIEKALDIYQKSLAKFQTLNNPSSVASTLESIGSLYQTKGEYQQAIDAFKKAVNIFSKINRTLEVSVLYSLASLYRDLGDYEQSLSTFQEAMKISKQIKFDTFIDIIKLGIAKTYFIRGQFSEKVNSSTNEASIDYKEALKYLQQSLKYNYEKGNANAEIIKLTNISRVYEFLKNYPQAIDSAEQALALCRKKKLKFGERLSLNNLSSAYQAAGKYPEALETINQLISLSRQAGDISYQASAYRIQGKVYAEIKQPQKAIEAFKQSLALRQKTKNTTEQAIILYEMAKVERDRGNLTVALEDIQQATDIIESSRNKVDDKDLRTSYFATKQDYYKFKIDLLMELHKKQPSKGYDALALNTSERSRARSLVDLLKESNAKIRKGANPELLQQETSLLQQINARETLLENLGKSPNTNELIIKNATQRLTTEIVDLRNQYKELQAKIRISNPKYAQLINPDPNKDILKLPEIQQQLDKDTILLQYSLGEKRSYLWLVTPDSLQVYELPKAKDIEKAVEKFRDAILASPTPYGKDHPDEISQTASQLSQMILAPVANKLGKKRLLIVADGALQTVSFAALPDINPPQANVETRNFASLQNPNVGTKQTQKSTPYQPLMINHEIVNLPSVTALATQRKELANRTPAPKTIAILADPVYSDTDCRLTNPDPNCKDELAPELQGVRQNSASRAKSQLTSGLEVERSTLERSAKKLNRNGWRRLPNSGIEAKKILDLVKSLNKSPNILEALNFEANYNWATNPALNQFKILHFATHGIADGEKPENSGIILSLVDKQGKQIKGLLSLGDLFDRDYPAELVVLSACQTGLGKNVSGEGLIGLTRGLMYAGAERVAVSLWSVDDEGTSVLMQEFYKQMLQENKTPAAAMRAAQIKLSQDPKWQSPYYWSAFTVSGEWR